MKWLWRVLAGLVLCVAALWTVGALQPREHRAACRATFRADRAALFAVLTDVDAYPSWRADVKSVRRLEPEEGVPTFVEETSQGPIRYAVEASEAPSRLVLRIADGDLPYGGTWTFALAPSGTGTALTITEDGFVDPPIFRVLARFVFGYHATLEAYLAHLAQKLGEAVTVERLP